MPRSETRCTRECENCWIDIWQTRHNKGTGGAVKTYIALDSEQVKSATENVGTFDAENPDIRYDLTDEEARKATEWEQALWDRAYEQAARNAENGQKNTAREGGTRFS